MGPNNRRNIIGASLIALAVLLFWALVMPERRKASDFQENVQMQEADLSERLQIAQKLKELKDNSVSRETDIKNLGLIVPSKKDIAELISSFDKISSISGMQLLQINAQPQAVVPTDAFNGVSVVADLSGDFNSIKSFLENIEQNIRLLDVETIQISPDVQSSSTQVRISLQAKAYFLK
jgi:Tfp pilus assembly protein PilO